MADTLVERPGTSRVARDVTAWDRLKVHRDWLGMWFMLPALAILILFLAYPPRARGWALVHRRAHRPHRRVHRHRELEWLWGDSVFWLSVFNTAALYRGRQHHQICRRALSRGAAQPQPPVQGDHPLGRADSLHRAHRGSRRSRSGGSTTASSPSSHGRCAKAGGHHHEHRFSRRPLETRAGR